MDVPVFSPSQTADFEFCPRYWALRREGWTTRLVEYPELAGVLGSGVSAAMEVYNTLRMEGCVASVETAISAGVAYVRETLAGFQANGRRIAQTTKAVEAVDRMEDRLIKAVRLVCANDPLAEYEIEATELSFPKHGYARPDVLARNQHGRIVADYKCKVELEARWKSKELERYSSAGQPYHYCWMAEATRYAIILIVLGPKAYVHMEPYAVSMDYGPRWIDDAQLVWAEIDRAKRGLVPVRGRTSDHRNPYGDCSMKPACTQYNLDPAMMTVEYMQIKREVR